MVTHEDYVDFWEHINRWEEEKHYVFDKLCLVEVPVHFCAYSRYWRINSELVQPELILRSEREPFGIRKIDYEQEVYNGSPGMSFLVDYTEKTVSYEVRKKFVGNLFFDYWVGKIKTMEVKNEGYDGLLWLPFQYGVWSPEFEGVEVLFRVMQNGAYESMTQFDVGMVLSDKVGNQSLQELMQTYGFDSEKMLCVVGDELIRRILCRVSQESLRSFNIAFLHRHAWRNFSYEEYCEVFEREFGFSLLEMTRHLYNRCGQPSFYFRDFCFQKVYQDGSEMGRMFSVKVWNKGNQDGVLSLSQSHYFFPAGACKEIRLYIPDLSDNLAVSVFCGLARNKPSQQYWQFPVCGLVNEVREGAFDTDTLAFVPEEGVYIVDDLDAGFHVLENNRWVAKLRKIKRDNSPERWEKRISPHCGYGEPVKGEW